MFLKSNISPIGKITLAALFIALTVICQKVLAVNNLPFAPFLRVSFGGPALIIFSSIILGPFYGLLVGAGSDLLGMFVLDPNPWMFQITLWYSCLGFFSYFIFNLVRNIKFNKATIVIESLVLIILFALLSVSVWVINSFTLFSTTYTLVLWQKILIQSCLAIFLAIILIILFVLNKRINNPICDTNNIFLAMFIIELVIMVIVGVLMKSWAFGFTTFIPILLTQIMVGFFNLPLNVVICNIFLNISKKYFVQ